MRFVYSVNAVMILLYVWEMDKSVRRLRWVGMHLAWGGRACRVSVVKHEGNQPFARPRCRFWVLRRTTKKPVKMKS